MNISSIVYPILSYPILSYAGIKLELISSLLCRSAEEVAPSATTSMSLHHSIYFAKYLIIPYAEMKLPPAFPRKSDKLKSLCRAMQQRSPSSLIKPRVLFSESTHSAACRRQFTSYTLGWLAPRARARAPIRIPLILQLVAFIVI
jgi:hypothetical protein